MEEILTLLEKERNTGKVISDKVIPQLLYEIEILKIRIEQSLKLVA